MRHINRAVFFAACCAVVLSSGCAGLTETGRGIAGVSTKILEDGRKNAVKKSYPVNYARCKEMVDSALADNNAYIYARSEKKKMIAFYMSATDTTPVGIFFTGPGDTSTEILVSSPSRYAKEFIADKISAWIAKPPRSVPEPAVAGSSAAAVADKNTDQPSK